MPDLFVKAVLDEPPDLPPELALRNAAVFWDDPAMRRHWVTSWLKVPRRQEDAPALPAPPGYRPCPVPSVGRHARQPGHAFTSDGRCWVPGER